MKALLGRGLARLMRQAAAAAAILVACNSFQQIAYGQYIEKYETWSATTADTWQTKALAAAPFGVPANAMVGIMVLKKKFNGTYWDSSFVVGHKRMFRQRPAADYWRAWPWKA